jgi:hypothetical protein
VNIGCARGRQLWIRNLDLQGQAFRKTRCKKIFREQLSGASRARPEFQGMGWRQ